MSGITELARMLKDRENKPMQGIGVGFVISASPLLIGFGGLELSKDNTCMVSLSIEDGDSVIVIPSADDQTYYIVGKVG